MKKVVLLVCSIFALNAGLIACLDSEEEYTNNNLEGLSCDPFRDTFKCNSIKDTLYECYQDDYEDGPTWHENEYCGEDYQCYYENEDKPYGCFEKCESENYYKQILMYYCNEYDEVASMSCNFNGMYNYIWYPIGNTRDYFCYSSNDFKDTEYMYCRKGKMYNGDCSEEYYEKEIKEYPYVTEVYYNKCINEQTTAYCKYEEK